MFQASRGRRWAVVLLVPFLLGALLWASWPSGSEPQAPRHARSPRAARPAASPDKPLRIAQASPPAPAPSAAAPAVHRALPPPSPRALKLYQLGKRLGVHEARLEDPCVAPSGATCSRTALTPFFESLDALSSRE
ncbi:MAG TPA: hypothetical protein VEZ71_12810, partial [Archangium sp.]|nr:hypothetical protein [Archangium sp.]